MRGSRWRVREGVAGLPQKVLSLANGSRITIRMPSTTTPIDVRKYFNTDLPAALALHAQAARAVGARYQFVIVGVDGGEWTVDLSAKGPSCKPGKTAADCTITLSDANFRILCERPEVHAMQLYMSAKLKVDGNTAVALKLGKLLSLVSLPKATTTSAPAPKPAPKVQPAPQAPAAPKPATTSGR